MRLLDSRPGWRRLYSDPYAVVFAEDDALLPPAAAPPAAGPKPSAKPGTKP